MNDDHSHDGLAADLARLKEQTSQRRRAMQWLAGAGLGAVGLWGCGGGGSDTAASTGTGAGTTTTTTTTSTGSTGTVSTCSVIPEETAGPFPGDGSNNGGAGGVANALMLGGIVRSDVRTSIAAASGVAQGVPLTVKLRVVNTNGSCADLSSYAVYLWHCDREGRYSMYSSGVTAENYLRGVQSTDSSGTVAFTTVFPGCYAGRMPHIHFEIYRSATTATAFSNKLKTSQLAFPAAACNEVYAVAGYEASVSNFSRISFVTDNVFSDGVSTQTAAVSGSVVAGYVATLNVGISV